ncbi:MAG: hypothetical protein ACTSU3_09610 [Candidatus Thorarchaeota archaeon]
MVDDDISIKMNETQQSLREEIIGRHSVEGFGLKKREISVMTRMNSDIVEIIDALVELEIFKSRSEAVAAFVERVINARKKMFDEITTQAKDIRNKRDSARQLAMQAMIADKEEQ